jgi:hypothetical protein
VKLMGREGRGPVEVITAIAGEPGDFGDGTGKYQQPVAAPGKTAAKRASAELRRSTAYGGFGTTEETYDHMHAGAKGEAPPSVNESQ